MRFFPTDSSGFPMSGINDRFVGEGPELFPDTAQQRRVVAARQIGPADTFPKQHVTADQEALGRAIETNAAWRMPGEEKNGELIIPVPQGYRPAGRKEYEFAPVILKGHAPAQTHFRRPGKYLHLFFVEMEG